MFCPSYSVLCVLWAPAPSILSEAYRDFWISARLEALSEGQEKFSSFPWIVPKCYVNRRQLPLRKGICSYFEHILSLHYSIISFYRDLAHQGLFFILQPVFFPCNQCPVTAHKFTSTIWYCYNTSSSQRRTASGWTNGLSEMQ